MIKSITIKSTFKNWYRFYCKEQESLTIEFKSGVNVLVSQNGKGKTTFLNAIEEQVLNQENQDSVDLIGELNPERPNMFFFSVKDMNPELMMFKINPMKQSASGESAFWVSRNMLSHGQSTNELMEDIEEIVINGTAGCIIIDEPEIALDATNMAKLIALLDKLKDKAQFILVSHHPWLVLNRNFNVINFVKDFDYQAEMIQQTKKLKLLGE